MLTGTRVFFALCLLLCLPTAIAQAASPRIAKLADITYPQQEVTDPNGVQQEYFGNSVAMDGNTAIVGAQNALVGGVSKGRAFVYVFNGSSWVLQATLKAPDGVQGDGFGFSVAVSGNSVIVSAPYHTVGTKTQLGVVYIFVRSGTTWSKQAEFGPADGSSYDFFGGAVAIYGNTAVIGSTFHKVGTHAGQGTAYVYVRQLSSWTLQGHLNGPGSAQSDHWGSSVALYGNMALVGSPYHAVGGNLDEGAVDTFVRSGTSWSFQQQLTCPNSLAGDHCGWSVGLSGNTAIVGSPDIKLGGYRSGAANIFVQIGSTWYSQAQLNPNPAQDDVAVGASVSVSGNYAVIGAPILQVNGNVQQGAAWVYARSGNAWYQQGPFLSGADGATYDEFGGAVAISGLNVLVGAFGKAINSKPIEGAAYFLSPLRAGDDLEVDLSGPTWILHPDDVDSFTVTVRDHGTAESNVIVQLGVPAVLAYQSDTPSQGTYDHFANSWYVGSMNGTTATLTVAFKVKPPVKSTQVFTFRASTPIPDIFNGDNSALAGFTVAKVEQLVNGGFENYSGNSRIPIDWIAHNFSLADGKDTSAGNHEQGHTSVRITNTGPVTKSLRQELFGPTGSAGDAFRFSYWVQGSSVASTGQCLGRVQFYLGSTPVGAPKILACGLAGTFTFTRRTLLFKAPADYDDVIVTFLDSEPSGTIWLDGASLLR